MIAKLKEQKGGVVDKCTVHGRPITCEISDSSIAFRAKNRSFSFVLFHKALANLVQLLSDRPGYKRKKPGYLAYTVHMDFLKERLDGDISAKFFRSAYYFL